MKLEEKQRIKKFYNDSITRNAVKNLVREVFLRKRSDDVQYLAAKSLAVEFLEEAYKELEKVAKTADSGAKERSQVGL